MQVAFILQGRWRPSSSSHAQERTGCVGANAITLLLLVDLGSSQRFSASLVPAQQQEGSILIQLFITGPVRQAFQPPIQKQASHLADLLIHSLACGPSNEPGEHLAAKTQTSFLGGGFQRKLGGT